MKNKNKFLKIGILILLGSSFLDATEITTKTQKTKDEFCKKYMTEERESCTFCMTSKNSYVVITSENKKLESMMNSTIKKFVSKPSNAKKYVLDVLAEDSEMYHLSHEESEDVSVFSVTDRTFSLEKITYMYLGGAHGLHSTQFINFDKKSAKQLKLDDLFIKGYEKIFKSIAEKEYRRQEHVLESESLADKLYWFSDEFILPKEIGIGEDGLHLFYNSYEIQGYAAGPIDLVLNYRLLKEIIKPNSYLSPFIKQKLLSRKQIDYTVGDKFVAVNLKLKKISTNEIELEVFFNKNDYNTIEKGGVSLSFPQLKNKSNVLEKSDNGFERIKRYPASSSIFHFEKKKSIKSKYLLVEGEFKKWKEEKKSIKLRLLVPANLKTFKINIRTTMVENKKIINSPFRGARGQQGTFNYTFEVGL